MYWFIDPIKNHYADFDGRVGRQEYWMFVLFLYIIYIALEILHLGPLAFIFSLGTLLPHLAIGARRLHDTGRSGWWQLLWFIPIVGWIIIIVWLAIKTEPIDNAYGAPAVPKMGPEGTASVAASATVLTPATVESAPADATEKTPEQHS